MLIFAELAKLFRGVIAIKKVVLVDDHKLFLEGMAGILSCVEELSVIGRASNGKDAWQIIDLSKPDLVLMDITMPEVNGIELTRRLKKCYSCLKILIVSMHLDRRMIIEALKVGADGYALKEEEPEDLIRAVRVVLAGLIYLSPQVATMLVRDYIQRLALPETPKKLEILSPREKDILNLISEGKNAREISEQLCISRNTVDVHRRNLMQKLGCENLNELMRYAMREGLMDLDS